MKKLIVFLLLFSSVSFAMTEETRTHLRQMSMTFCSCRGGTYGIAFDTDKPLAKVFCRNNESRVFKVEESYEKCE